MSTAAWAKPAPALLLQEGIATRFKIVGFPDDHTVTGSQEEIFRHYGIDGPGLATTARQLFAKQRPIRRDYSRV